MRTRHKRKKILMEIGDTNGDGIINEKDFDSMDGKTKVIRCCKFCGHTIDENNFCHICNKQVEVLVNNKKERL